MLGTERGEATMNNDATIKAVLEYADDKCAYCPNIYGEVCDMCIVRIAVSHVLQSREEEETK